ncbi:MAG: hypothetical protein ACOYM9_24810 [Bradymonadia bacterium]
MSPPGRALRFVVGMLLVASTLAGCEDEGASAPDATVSAPEDATVVADPDATVSAPEDATASAPEDAAADAAVQPADAQVPELDATVDATVDPPVNYAETFRAVRIDASFTPAEQLSVHACAGLYNARLGGSVLVVTDEDVPQAGIDGSFVRDELWLEPLELAPSETVPARDFLSACVADFGGCVRYTHTTQREFLPSILTAAAALGVPMLADESELSCLDPTFDATEVFAGFTTQREATEFVYQNFLGQTTGLAMLNPGYDRFASDLSAPALVDEMPVALIDFVFSRRLFVVFLVNGCVDAHPEETLLGRIVNESGWPTPVGVFGYNDSWLAGGYLYEAQTRCLPSANMGAIPTRTTNLSFFDTRRPAIVDAQELPRTPPEALDYDPTRTYVAFVIGDGDNVRYIMSTRRDWLQQRLDRCAGADPVCPPLSWTISPHLPDLAPDVLQWYYEAASTTGADFFTLPPSGYQYAYPGRLPSAEQARFAAATENVARLLGTRSVVHWEWFDGWRRSVDEFLPRYAHLDGQVRGIFPVNVPYVIEAFPAWPAEKTYEVLEGADGGRAVLFRSQTWRGVDGRDGFHPTPEQMADRLGGLPRGTVTWVYMTSDGGLTLENSYVALSALLTPHVQLVSADAAAELALEAGR